MADINIKIQKSQVRFFENSEVELGTPITCQDIKQAMDTKVAEIKAQFARDNQARDDMRACPGVTEDENWFYATITV